MVLTRENILKGVIRQMLIAKGVGHHLLPEDAIRDDLRQALARRPAGSELWMFGYGSLIWNPCFHFEERMPGRIHGWHRRFCLWTNMGRGSPECPGLMLGLENGGSCHGLAFRVAEAQIETELEIIWLREMLTGSYRSTWVRARLADGRTVPALTFTINHDHPRYAGRLAEAVTVEAIALAQGPLGTNCEYLFNTVTHLEALDLVDHALHRLQELVRARQQREVCEDPVQPASAAS